VPTCGPAFWCCPILRVLLFIKLNHEIELNSRPICAVLLGWALPTRMHGFCNTLHTSERACLSYKTKELALKSDNLSFKYTSGFL